MNPYRVTLVRSPRPLQTVEARREWKARALLVVALLAAMVLVLLSGCAEPKAVEAPHSLCKWPAPECSSQPPSLGVHFLRDLRAERIGRAP